VPLGRQGILPLGSVIKETIRCAAPCKFSTWPNLNGCSVSRVWQVHLKVDESDTRCVYTIQQQCADLWGNNSSNAWACGPPWNKKCPPELIAAVFSALLSVGAHQGRQ